jgi:hypothetical protein
MAVGYLPPQTDLSQEGLALDVVANTGRDLYAPGIRTETPGADVHELSPELW